MRVALPVVLVLGLWAMASGAGIAAAADEPLTADEAREIDDWLDADGYQPGRAGILQFEAEWGLPPTGAKSRRLLAMMRHDAPPTRPGEARVLTEDITYCRVMLHDRKQLDHANWTGACRDGVADGPGTLVAFYTRAGGPQADAFETTIIDGYLSGFTTTQFRGGPRYSAVWRRGVAHDMLVNREEAPAAATTAGPVILPNGDRYEGELLDGQPHGEGTLWTEEFRYVGQFHRGKAHGRLRVHDSDGVLRIDGTFDQGSLTGSGTIYRPDGGRYVGAYVGGLPHGSGTEFFADGGQQSGHFTNGKLNGFGTTRWANGDLFEGNHVAGAPSGHGKFTAANGTVAEGQVDESGVQGHGVITSPDGTTYVGQMRNNQAHGQGRKTFADGNSYEGGFERGEYHGWGVFRFASGDWCQGHWQFGWPVGRGTGGFQGRSATCYAVQRNGQRILEFAN